MATGLYQGYQVGCTNRLSISHLQFVDNILILGEKSWANVRSMRAVLTIFEQVSRLKVNFHKSMLIGVNFSDSWLHPLWWWIVVSVLYHSFIWGCQLVGVLGGWSFENQWLTGSLLDCWIGKINFFHLVVVWYLWNLSRRLFRFTFFPSSRPPQV